MKKALIAGLLTSNLAVCAVSAKDWPQWGGTPERNMYSPEKGLPEKFEPGKPKRGTEEIDLSTTKNVKWVAKLGSQSYGNATVANGKVFVGTNNDAPRDEQHQGDRSIMMVFDEKNGGFLWQLIIPKLASGKVNDWENLGLLSSPTIEGDRVYIVTSRCEVMCLDVNGLSNGNQGAQNEAQYLAGPGRPPVKVGAKDADIIWVYDMIDDLGVFPHNASNCSVLIVGDVVYACTSNGQDWSHSNIPSPLSPSFIALNKKTGELLGEDDANIGPRIFHGQWSSPSTGVVNGKPLVFFGGGDGFCYAFDPTPVKGDDANFLKKVWWFDCNPPEYKVKDGKPIQYPAAEGPSEINSTPVFWKNRVYVAIGQDPEHGEGVGNLLCINPGGKGDITKTGKIWNFQGINRSISSVSITPEGLLFIGDFSGFVYCLNADTGELYWKHDMKAHMWGSTLVADGKVYVGDEDGDLVVLAASKEKKILSRMKENGRDVDGPNLGAPVYSTPVVANGVLYISSNTHLYAIHDEARAKATSDQPQNVELKN
jgi:outer membrane protein assembly factor BamB